MKALPPLPTKEELEKAGIRICIGVPMPKSIDWQPFITFWGVAMQGWPLCIIPYAPTYINRHKITRSLLESRFTHVLMLDADHKWQPDVVLRHARWLLRHPELMVIGGMHHRRCEPYEPCAFHIGPDGKLHAPAVWDDGLMKVDAIGTGSLLISRKVFESVPPPWWGLDCSQMKDDVYPGEDMFFSALCNKHNIGMYVDTTITSKHMTFDEVDREKFEAYVEAHPPVLLNAASREKHLVIDGVIFQLQSGRPAGISRIWQNLIPELMKAMPDWEIFLLRRRGFPTGVPGVSEIEIPAYDFMNREHDAEIIERKCKELGASCFMSTYYSRAKTTPAIQMAYDMAPEALQFPDNLEWTSKREAFKAATEFISISQSTADNLAKFYLRESTVALCGVSNVFSRKTRKEIREFRKDHKLPDDYVLLPGNRRGYKNGQAVFEALRGTEINLVCAGGEAPNRQEIMDNAYFFPHCKPEDMALLYSGAICTVYPSVHEGFGLPVLEALSCGCPVIAGRNTSIPEAGGEAVIYCDVNDPQDILNAIRKVKREDPKVLVNGLGWDETAKVVEGVIREYEPKGVQKSAKRKALLSYVDNPKVFDQSEAQFSNIGIARSWVNVLKKLGYEVDVIDWKGKPAPGAIYDLVAYHGGHNTSDVLACAKTDALKIYFGTGMPCDEFNRLEGERFDALELRRGVRLPPDRKITVDENAAYKAADGIISLGKEIQSGVYPAPVMKKEYSGKKKFLFLSGWGNVHKGLDLLLEAFEGIGAELYIATKIDPGFAKVYARELGLPNIHVLGWVDPNSEDVLKCDWVILPSCAEGQPGSVLECMARGLIPITSAECHISEGIHLDDCGIETIRKVVLEASQYEDATVESLAKTVIERTQRDHSPEAFEAGLEKEIRKIGAKRPLVTAIVSVYNCEKYIRGRLENLEAQTIADRLEIMVVDTGSEEGEGEIVGEFKEKYGNVVYIRTEERRPIPVAWNAGVLNSKGKYLTSANADDRFAKDGLEKLVMKLENEPEIDLVYGNQFITRTDNAEFGETSKYSGRFDWHEPDIETLKSACYCGPMPLWRKTLHERFHFFDEKLTSAFDWEFWLRIALGGAKMAKLKDYVGLYLERDDSAEHKAKKEGVALRETVYIQNKLCPEKVAATVEIAKANGIEVLA